MTRPASVVAVAPAVHHPIRAASSWLVFPALLFGVVGGTLALFDAELAPPAVSGIVLGGVVAVLLVLERIVPLHRGWNRFPDRTDLVLVVVNRAVEIGILAAALAIFDRFRAATLWPVEAPLVVQAMLGLAIAEAIRYVVHRLAHRPGWLWRVHRVHHAPERMYTLNGPRLHPVNYLWVSAATIVPMLALGAALPAVILVANITAFFVLFQHANVRLRFDGWNRIFATPDVHRSHHLRTADAGVNYAIVLLVYDVVFGTARAPAREPEASEIGLAP